MATKKKPKMRIGGHVSAAGGLKNAIRNAQAIGASTIQIFGSSPRTFAVSMPNTTVAEDFRQMAQGADVEPVFLHAPYLINLASPKEDLRSKSEKLLAGHLKIAEMIGAEGVIFHLGSSKGWDKNLAIKMEAVIVQRILKDNPGSARLLLENSAGGGDKIGSTLQEISELLKLIKSPRAGVCFDTAHAYEAGIVMDGYSTTTVRELSNAIAETIGWEHLRVIHANDSKTAQGSNHDRHENIGEGEIGKTGFQNLFGEPKFRNLPWLLEVPGFTGEGPDKKNVDILKHLAEEAVVK